MDASIYRVSSSGSPGSIYIGSFHSEGCIGPDAFAQLAWVPGAGLQIRMWSYDRRPIADCTELHGAFRQDSRLACCIDFFPRCRCKGYVSIEFNANGVCRCSFGPNGHDRESLIEMGLSLPDVRITHPTRDGGKCWMAETMIPVETIQILYNLSPHLQPGHQMRANFYTACESAPAPYWGAWRPVIGPDFHQYECFGLLEII